MMNETKRLPSTLLEAIRYFEDPDVANEFVARLRWPDGPRCPDCGKQEHSYISTRRLWKCKNCKRQYSVKVGTIFEDSPLSLDKWLCSIWLIANAKNGISSHELGRAIGLTQKSAWFVLHRIRLAMQTGSFEKFSGEVEVDETFWGGRAKFMHTKERKRKISGSGAVDKTAILGMKERDSGHVRAMVVPGRGRLQLHPRVRAHVEPGSTPTCTMATPAIWSRTTAMKSLTTLSNTSTVGSTQTGWRISGACSSVGSREPTSRSSPTTYSAI
jgi:transposase-like protein